VTEFGIAGPDQGKGGKLLLKSKVMRHHLGPGVLFIALLLIAGCASAPLDYPQETTLALEHT
jgi:hypothetical protein